MQRPPRPAGGGSARPARRRCRRRGDVVQSGVIPRHRPDPGAPQDGTRSLTGDEFAALVAHELRSPLNALAGWLHLLGTDPALRGGAPARALDGARRALSQQCATIDLLARVLRLRSGDGLPQRAPTDLGTVLDEALAVLGPAAAAAGRAIESRRHGGPAALAGDGPLLREALVALGTHAIRNGTPGAPVRMALHAAPGSAVLSIHVDEGEPGRTSIWYAFGHAPAGLPLELLHAVLAVQAHGGWLGPEGTGRTGEAVQIRLPNEAAPDVPPGGDAPTLP